MRSSPPAKPATREQCVSGHIYACALGSLIAHIVERSNHERGVLKFHAHCGVAGGGSSWRLHPDKPSSRYECPRCLKAVAKVKA